MADGVLASSLEQAMCKLFLAHRLCRKTGGHVLTPDFGTIKNLFKMASNREVFYMKKFRIVDTNIFEVWAIAIWSHLEGRSCVRNTEILYSEHYSADYTPKMASYGKPFYRNCLCLIETIDFDIKIIQIHVRMQKLEQSECSPITRRDVAPPTRRMPDG